MPEYFDEMRPYWGYKWCLLRQIWVELMELLIHTWLEDIFRRIIGALDGEMVITHDLTEECASFNIARILIDCFQWELIQEWISVCCEGIEFEVYVKEFGAEVLSQQMHQEDEQDEQGEKGVACSVETDSSENMIALSKRCSEVEETIIHVGAMWRLEWSLLTRNPLIIEGKRREEYEVHVIKCGNKEGLTIDHSGAQVKKGRIESELGLALLFEEASAPKAHQGMEGNEDELRLVKLFEEANNDGSNNSWRSCPFPPGLGLF
ncbi:hypothetical protein PIB30_080533 [Stylosanthes scabra]|uniref:Uncharacterized protein n=1 Tax=Stylosanthes scabra TaxID=79078 RepID=A0ABU6RRJ6_9FABA|nr:hypothetical protein [Stylosanthes scabra]